MIPVLYSRTSTSFSTRGLGPLSDAIECTVEEELNGVYQLRLVYPVDGVHASDIKTMTIITAVPAYNKSPQPFDVFRVSMPKYNRLEVEARHISYRLNKSVVMPFSTPDSHSTITDTLQLLKSYCAEQDNFTYWSNVTQTAGLAVIEPTPVRNVLGGMDGCLVDSFGGEIEWDGFAVKLWKQRGSDNHVKIRYGKNMADYHQEENNEGYTASIIPFWRGKDTNGNDVVVAPGDIMRPSGSSIPPYPITVPMDFSSYFDTKPTAFDLRSAARAYLSAQGLGGSKISMDVSLVDLAGTEEYKNFASISKVNLGDTVTVEYENLSIDAQTRVTRTVYDVLKDRYKEISLGDAKIRGQSAQGAVAPVKKQVSQINNAVNAITESETALITLPSSFTNNSEARNFYYRKGNICMIGFDCTPSSRVSDVTLVTLPTTCRPVKALRLSALPSLSRSTDDGDTQYVAVKIDGTVTYTGSARLCQVYTFICNGG